MSCVKFVILQQCIIHIHRCLFFFSHWLHCSLHSFLEIKTIIIVIKRKEHALWCPYRSRAKARVVSEIEKVQEQMKVDMEAMKEQMTTMMEAMMTMRKMTEVNTTIFVVTSTATEVDLTHPSGLNQVNHPMSDMVGQGGRTLGSTSGPHFVQSRASIPSHHMACLPTIHHPMLHTLPIRMSITPLPYPLRANNPNLVMHKSLNPSGRRMKYPETTL